MASDTGELKEIVGALSEAVHEMSEQFATERAHRTKERISGLSVLKLHVPLGVVLALFMALSGVVIAAGAFVNSTRDHIANKKIHVDASQAETKSGVAYVDDVARTIDARVSLVEKNDRSALRLMLSSAPIKCRARPSLDDHGFLATSCQFQQTTSRQ